MSLLVNDLTPEDLRCVVAKKYGQVAIQPDADHPFPVGRTYAISLGYAPDVLDNLPIQAVNSFAGISNPLAHAALQTGEIVLDLGCGGGLDTLISARQIGSKGHVHSLDLSKELLASARSSAVLSDLTNITFHQAPAETVPLPDALVDAIIVNGIFNLCTDKAAVMHEAHRLLHPGGRMLVSEIVIMGGEGANQDMGTCNLDGVILDDWFR
jgi:arsenite methyltransferase